MNAIAELKAKIDELRRQAAGLEYALSILEGTPSPPSEIVPGKVVAPRPARTVAGYVDGEPHVYRVMRVLRDGPMLPEEIAAKLTLQRKVVMMVFHNHGKRIERVNPNDINSKLKLTAKGVAEAQSL